MNKLILISCMLAIAVATIAQQSDISRLSGPYLGQKPPGNKPEIFAPGIITTERTEHGTVTFSPDGNEVFWAVIFSDPFRKKIMTMKSINNQWTHPQIASFSLGENEGNPFCSPDGKMVFFTGWRSAEGYGGDKHLIMYAERTHAGWSEPKLVDHVINSVSNFWQVSLAMNGNLYFCSEKDGGGIFYSRTINGQYSLPEKVEVGIKGATPFIAPDESYIVFSAADQPEGYGEIDLYISYKQDDGSWSSAKNLGSTINTGTIEIWPIISPDGKYLFFTSSRKGHMDIYWVSAKFFEELKPKELK